LAESWRTWSCESVITKRSAEEMKLKVGDTVTAVIKSTEVMLEKK